MLVTVMSFMWTEFQGNNTTVNTIFLHCKLYQHIAGGEGPVRYILTGNYGARYRIFPGNISSLTCI